MESNSSKEQEYEIKYSKTKYKKMVEDVSKAEDRNALILFIGAGVSISQGYPNWNEYIDKLIKYWTFHLSDLIDKEITKEKEVMRQDVLLLDQLLESNMDKKRKVDLVHHMIKKYTKIDGNEEGSKTRYEENLLNFERLYFKYLPVCSENNEILLHLVNLNATYITTNYDSEIEKHVQKCTGNKIDVLNDLSEVSSDIKKNSVIHLHGTPDCNPKFFISSANSYVNLYYPNKNEETSPLQNIKEIIQRKSDATIVFIGCSMEEDEVLSILKLAEDEKEDKEKEIKYYALLKYDNSINLQIREHYHNNFNDYMHSTKNVDIIWYGDKFDDLPKFCERLVNDVTLKREENMSSAEFDWRILNGE